MNRKMNFTNINIDDYEDDNYPIFERIKSTKPKPKTERYSSKDDIKNRIKEQRILKNSS
jgi:hypothetical protein